MKRFFVTSFIIAVFALNTSVVQAQSSYRESLVSQLYTLLQQLASLQVQLAQLHKTETPRGISAKTLEPSKYYQGPYQAIYLVSDTDIDAYGETIPTAEDAQIWTLITDVFGKDTIRSYITEFRLYYDPDATFDAFVEQLGEGDEWIVGVNTAAVHIENQEDYRAIIELFVHEYAHILYHYNASVGQVFEDTFWQRASHNKDHFVSAYAMTDPEEDFAESFMYFVLDKQLKNNPVVMQKVHFFYTYDAFETAREAILDRMY